MIRKNIEYEKRLVISKSDYDIMLHSFARFKKIESIIYNIYYDLDKPTLINQGYLFRLRNNNNFEFELTLKIKKTNGNIEHNMILSRDEYLRLSQYEYMSIPNDFKSSVMHLHIPNNIIYKKCELQTRRIEIEVSDYLLVLDENKYNGIIDYNFEVEANSMKRANQVYKDLVKTFYLKEANTQGKSTRALSTIK